MTEISEGWRNHSLWVTELNSILGYQLRYLCEVTFALVNI